VLKYRCGKLTSFFEYEMPYEKGSYLTTLCTSSNWPNYKIVSICYSVKFIVYTVMIKCINLRISATKTKGMLFNGKFPFRIRIIWPPLWFSGQSSWLQIQWSRVRFPGTTKNRVHSADKRRSLGRYSSLADSDHGVIRIIISNSTLGQTSHLLSWNGPNIYFTKRLQTQQ
jgi:hypothetical protein